MRISLFEKCGQFGACMCGCVCCVNLNGFVWFGCGDILQVGFSRMIGVMEGVHMNALSSGNGYYETLVEPKSGIGYYVHLANELCVLYKLF